MLLSRAQSPAAPASSSVSAGASAEASAAPAAPAAGAAGITATAASASAPGHGSRRPSPFLFLPGRTNQMKTSLSVITAINTDIYTHVLIMIALLFLSYNFYFLFCFVGFIFRMSGKLKQNGGRQRSSFVFTPDYHFPILHPPLCSSDELKRPFASADRSATTGRCCISPLGGRRRARARVNCNGSGHLFFPRLIRY